MVFVVSNCRSTNDNYSMFEGIKCKHLFSVITITSDTFLGHCVYLKKIDALADTSIYNFSLLCAEKHRDVSYILILNKNIEDSEQLESHYLDFSVYVDRVNDKVKIRHFNKYNNY